jgi:hypothetical protein
LQTFRKANDHFFVVGVYQLLHLGGPSNSRWLDPHLGVPYFQNPFVVAICCNFSDLLHQWFQGSQPPPWPIWPRGDVPVFALQHPPPRDRPRRYVVETCLSLFGGIPKELVHLYISMRVLNLNKLWGYIYIYIYIYIHILTLYCIMIHVFKMNIVPQEILGAIFRV